MTNPNDKLILVVDDEPDVRTYFQVALEEAGFQVSVATNGDEALEEVEKRRPDLISLDLVMPKKTGIKFLYQLRKNNDWAQIPVLVVTAHAKDEMGKNDLEEIMSNTTLSGPGVLEKPVNSRKYVNSIKQILDIEITESGDDPLTMKQELQEKLKQADADTLKNMLELMNKK